MDEKKQIEAGKAPKPPNRPPTLTDLEHAGHDRALREVAREEVVVRGHALVADRVDARLPLEDAVDEEEGVAVRQHVLDREDVKDGRRLGNFCRPGLGAIPDLRGRLGRLDGGLHMQRQRAGTDARRRVDVEGLGCGREQYER